MIWKNWPYWVKGGIIGLLSGISLIILSVIIGVYLDIVYFLIIPTIIFAPFILLFGWIMSDIANPQQSSEGMAIFFSSLPLSIIVGSIVYGIIIGFIIGKIKSRKTQNENNNKSG